MPFAYTSVHARILQAAAEREPNKGGVGNKMETRLEGVRCLDSFFKRCLGIGMVGGCLFVVSSDVWGWLPEP